MTRVFTEEGVSVPVTVLEIEPNYICQIKTAETDGYQALQVTTGKKKASRVNKPISGHYQKSKIEPGRGLWEFRTDVASYEVGQALTVEVFTEGQYVDVVGTSKGKGYAGAIKRHNFSMQDATHGNSLSHRSAGSIGQNQSPGRVFKGKKMAGQMGNARCTVQSLEIVKLCTEKGLILVKGSVPGAPGGDVIIKPAAKKEEAK
jgi:large subunit ribosomal protein L3